MSAHSQQSPILCASNKILSSFEIHLFSNYGKGGYERLYSLFSIIIHK